MAQLNIQYPNLGNVLAKGAYIKNAEARNALLRQELENRPEEQNWLRKSRQREETEWSQQDEDRQRRIKREEEDRMRQLSDQDKKDAIFRIQMVSEWLTKFKDIPDYAEFYKWVGQQDWLQPYLNQNSLAHPNEFFNDAGIPDEARFDNWRKQQIALGMEKAKEIEEYTLGERQARFKGGKMIAKGDKWGKPTEKGSGESKLTASQKAQKEAYMKEYGNNLAIIKAYKTGYDPMGFGMKVTEEDYNQAVSRNKELDEWFGELGVDPGSREDLLNEAIKIAQGMQKTPKREVQPKQPSSAKGSWRQYQ